MTLEEAKQEYFKYNCSTFGMFRDGRYREFSELNISKSVLDEWKQEKFNDIYEEFRKTKSYELFFRMYECTQRNRKDLFIMKKVVMQINYETMQIKSAVSGKILGSLAIDQRSGMIFWAYDIGEKEIAKELLKFVIKLLTDREEDEKIEEETKWNIKHDIELCHQIDYKLQLGVLNRVTLKGLVNCWIGTVKSKKRR